MRFPGGDFAGPSRQINSNTPNKRVRARVYSEEQGGLQGELQGLWNVKIQRFSSSGDDSETTQKCTTTAPTLQASVDSLAVDEETRVRLEEQVAGYKARACPRWCSASQVSLLE